MDGAIADGEGPAFPLICTTSKNVIGNLTKNLDSYLKAGGTRRKAVAATSQELTPKKRQNLVIRATELGFDLVQVYDRAALADRLHGNPKWCLELLNLTGDASVISVEPLTTRPLLHQELIGREADLAWLRESSGDRLLVGHPGSGKTSLLRSLARDGWGLFLVGSDLARVAPEIRSRRPGVLIVDDAHVEPKRLVRLVQLRRELSADFSIVASVWPGEEARVANLLGTPPSQIRELDLLTRDQIVQVVRSMGFVVSTALIREIVNQARGRPGLAVTLANFCRGGGVREVALGTALKNSVHSFLEDLIGERAIEILAVFAIGGSQGVEWGEVAKAFGLSVLDVRRIVVGLAASGVVIDLGENYVAVQPPILGQALVRDLFFNDPSPLDIRPFMESARNLQGLAETLVGVKAVGGRVPAELLWDALQRSGWKSTWVNFAWLGRSEALRVLQEKPELLSIVAEAALHHAAEVVIGPLLTASVGDPRNLDSYPDHPMRKIQDWIAEAQPGQNQVLERRSTLLRAVTAWMAQGGDEVVGMSAISIALSPQCSWTDCDPGAGRTMTLWFGYLAQHELYELGELWGRSLESLRSLGSGAWKSVLGLLRAWVYPDPRLGTESHHHIEVRQALRVVTIRMLHDVATLCQRPGVHQELERLAAEIDVRFSVRLDSHYEILFPGRKDLRVDWRMGEARQLAAAHRLAETWATCEPSWVARRIAELTTEAVSLQNTWPDHSRTVCRLIAEQVERPIAWIRAMESTNAFGGHVEPFLRRMIGLGDPEWPSVIAEFLERQSWMGVIFELILTSPFPPANLLDEVLERLDRQHSDFIETLALRGQLPEDTLRRLLRHRDSALASATAIGEWLADPQGTVRNSLREDWKAAVVGDCSEGRDVHWLGEIFKSDPDLARLWLDSHLPVDPNALVRETELVSIATSCQDTPGRRELLRRLPVNHWDNWLISHIIGDDIEIYREFLAEPRWRTRRLDPLTWPSRGHRFEDEDADLSPAWLSKARVALETGCSPEDVARARLASPKTWHGDESVIWNSWLERFRALEEHDDDLIRSLARHGSLIATSFRDAARQRERDEAVFGH